MVRYFLPVTSTVHDISVTPKSYMQSSPVICSPRLFSAVHPNSLQACQSPTGPALHPLLSQNFPHPHATPAVPASPSQAPFQVQLSVPSGPKDGWTGHLGTLSALLPRTDHKEPPCLAVPLWFIVDVAPSE